MNALVESIADFHFLRPWWLLVPLAALWLPWAVQRRGDVRRRWRGTIAPHLLEALVIGENRRRPLRPAHFTALLLALGAVAMAGPTWQRERPPFLSDKAPLAIAVDLTPTMDAIDISPTRLERAKLKVKALLARRDGGRTALYAYAGSTHLVLPLTDDPTLLQTFADALQTRIMPKPGKDTALAVQTIDSALAAESVPGTILLLTDGVEPAAVEALRAHARTARTEVVVLAIGTETGGPLRDRDGTAPALDTATLHALRDAGIAVATVTPDSDADVAWVQRHVQQHVEQAASPDTVRWHDAGWPLTIPIALLALLWFRRGWTIRWIVGLAVAVAIGTPQGGAWAQQVDAPRGWRFADLWLTHDQQGRRAFERGDFVEAAGRFDDPMWRGIAWYRAGKFDAAAREFERVSSPDGHFNLGNALAQQGKYQQAMAHFRLVLQLRPGWAPAQRNLALMQQLLDRRKQKSNDDEEAPDLPPDKVEFDGAKPPEPPENDKTQQGLVQQSAEMWMRAIQTSPTELLARKFALQQQGKP